MVIEGSYFIEERQGKLFRTGFNLSYQWFDYLAVRNVTALDLQLLVIGHGFILLS